MMPAGTPILVLKEGTRRERGKGAQFNNIAAAKAVADAVRSTLGPRGMDKMLVDSLGDVVITNDGVTILKEIDIEHPAAKMLVEVAKTQDEEAGDGTTTAVILAGELLKRAEDLIEQNIHPTVIAAGYRLASDKAHEVLEKVASKISIKEVDTLKKVGMTSMSSKSASGHKELLADIAVKAVSTVAEKRADDSYFVDDDNIQVVKKQGGSIADTAMVDGIIVDKERVHPGMPGEVREGKIALTDPAPSLPKRGGVDAEADGRDGPKERGQRPVLPEGHRRSRAALPREGGDLRGAPREEIRHGETREGHGRQGRHEARRAREGRSRIRQARVREEDRRGRDDLRHGMQEPEGGIDPDSRRDGARRGRGRAVPRGRDERRRGRDRGRQGHHGRRQQRDGNRPQPARLRGDDRWPRADRD